MMHRFPTGQSGLSRCLCSLLIPQYQQTDIWNFYRHNPDTDQIDYYKSYPKCLLACFSDTKLQQIFGNCVIIQRHQKRRHIYRKCKWKHIKDTTNLLFTEETKEILLNLYQISEQPLSAVPECRIKQHNIHRKVQ